MNIEDFLPEDFKADEQDYWKVRNQLLTTYEGKWIAFHDQQIIACSDDIRAVTQEALQKSNSCAYIMKVGEEDKLLITKRRCEAELTGLKARLAKLEAAIQQLATTPKGGKGLPADSEE